MAKGNEKTIHLFPELGVYVCVSVLLSVAGLQCLAGDRCLPVTLPEPNGKTSHFPQLPPKEKNKTKQTTHNLSA